MWVVAHKEDEVCVAFEMIGNEKYIADLVQDHDTIKVIVKGPPRFFPIINESVQTMFCSE